MNPIEDQSTISLKGHTKMVMSLAVLSDGNLASSSSDSTIRIWCRKTGQTLRILRGHDEVVYALVSLPNKCTLASASADSTVKIWNTDSGKKLKTLKGISGYARCLAASSDGVLACGSKKQITVWFLDTENSLKSKRKKRLVDVSFRYGSVWSIAFLPNNMLASGSEDGMIRIWNLRSCKLVKQVTVCSNGYVMGLAVLSNETLACSFGFEGQINILNIDDLQTIRELKEHTRGVVNLLSLSNGNLVSCSNDKTIRVWDTKSWETLKVLNGHTESIRSLASFTDGAIASSSSDKTVKIWQI